MRGYVSCYEVDNCTKVLLIATKSVRTSRRVTLTRGKKLRVAIYMVRLARRPRRSTTELISESRNQGVRFNGRRHDTESCCRSIFNLQFCDKTVDTVERRVRGSEGADRRSKGAFESFVKIETTRRNASPETMKPRGRAWLVRALSWPLVSGDAPATNDLNIILNNATPWHRGVFNAPRTFVSRLLLSRRVNRVPRY